MSPREPRSAILTGTAFYGVLMAIMQGLSFRNMEGIPRGLTKDEIEFLRKIRDERVAELKRRGLTAFEFDNVTVYALNRKNAERKYNNFKNKLL